jgi:hypothetical protein
MTAGSSFAVTSKASKDPFNHSSGGQEDFDALNMESDVCLVKLGDHRAGRSFPTQPMFLNPMITSWNLYHLFQSL